MHLLVLRPFDSGNWNSHRSELIGFFSDKSAPCSPKGPRSIEITQDSPRERSFAPRIDSDREKVYSLLLPLPSCHACVKPIKNCFSTLLSSSHDHPCSPREKRICQR